MCLVWGALLVCGWSPPLMPESSEHPLSCMRGLGWCAGSGPPASDRARDFGALLRSLYSDNDVARRLLGIYKIRGNLCLLWSSFWSNYRNCHSSLFCCPDYSRVTGIAWPLCFSHVKGHAAK